MSEKFRDILDPSDPFWPRVRRLHVYLWGKGTANASNFNLVAFSFIWLGLLLLGTIASLTWRIAIIAFVIFIVDLLYPGIIFCSVKEFPLSYLMGWYLAGCDFSGKLATVLFPAIFSIITTLFILYPFKRTLDKVVELLFMVINIILLGYPLKWLGWIAFHSPEVAGKYFDKSVGFGSISAGMSGFLPDEENKKLDYLWKIYRKSQTPDYEEELEELLSIWENEVFVQ